MSNQQFSLRDCVMLAVVSLIVTVGLIGCGGGPSTGAQKMENSANIMRIHQAMILFCQGNNGFYPGRSSDGVHVGPLAATASNYGAAQPSNNDLSIVYALLLNGETLTPEELISPAEPGSKTQVPGIGTSHTVTNANYSYALLQVGNAQGNQGRLREWKETVNSQAPVAVDRSKMIDPTLTTTGIHDGDSSGDPTKWMGSIGWNDSHVSFEKSAVFQPGKLKFGAEANKAVDDLFNPTDGTSPDSNAMFTY